MQIKDQKRLWIVSQELEAQSFSDIRSNSNRLLDQLLFVPLVETKWPDAPRMECLSVGVWENERRDLFRDGDILEPGSC
jgi:hypothetical protein